MTANTIKIKELPIKKLNDISSEDIMVLEDTVDTKQISIEDLQIFFSSDKKITALKEALEKQISDLNKELTSKIEELSNKDSDLKKKVEDLFNDHENTKKRLGDLIEKVLDVQELLDTTIGRVSVNETAIKNLQTFTSALRKDLDTAIADIKKHDTRLANIEKKNNEQDKRLTTIEGNVKDLDKKVTDNIDRIDNSIANTATGSKEYSDQLYDQIMQYIDYYHHIHEDPPNFDDPQDTNAKLIASLYNVGSVYETTSEEFNPSQVLPGTWKYVGETYVYDTAGNPILCKYTFIRTE